MVDTNLLSVYDSTLYEYLPKLQPADVTAAVLYALGTSEHVQVNVVTLRVCVCVQDIHSLSRDEYVYYFRLILLTN